MALLLVQPGFEPAGQFALQNGQAVIGGEVGVLDTTGIDANGFQIIKARLATTADTSPFFLMDDGKTGYGTVFGNTVVKTDTGFAFGADHGIRPGPTTYSASGKVTLWNKPGLYAVTSDALTDNEATLKAAAPGTGLTFDIATGKLLLGNAAPQPLAYVVQYVIDDSLVTTFGSVVNNKKLIISFNPFGQP